MSLDNGDLKKIHGALPGLVDQLKEGKLDRREFLRTSTLLGLSASAAYALAGLSEPVKRGAVRRRGGTIRFSMRVIKIENPPIYDYVYDSNICPAGLRLPDPDRRRQRHPPLAAGEVAGERRSDDLDADPEEGDQMVERR